MDASDLTFNLTIIPDFQPWQKFPDDSEMFNNQQSQLYKSLKGKRGVYIIRKGEPDDKKILIDTILDKEVFYIGNGELLQRLRKQGRCFEDTRTPLPRTKPRHTITKRMDKYYRGKIALDTTHDWYFTYMILTEKYEMCAFESYLLYLYNKKIKAFPDANTQE